MEANCRRSVRDSQREDGGRPARDEKMHGGDRVVFALAAVRT
jgi:hypothetical protein